MNYITVNIPVNTTDLKQIEEIICKRDIVRSVYPACSFNQYSLKDYLEQVYYYNSEFTALLDRNIFSYIISVAKKTDNQDTTENQKAACALLAFLQLSHSLIEPVMAIYEGVDSDSYERAINELSLFRAVDCIHPQILVELALGRINFIPEGVLSKGKVDSIQKLKGEDIDRWRLHYGLTLKIAELERNGGKMRKKMEALLEWMHKDYLFSAPAMTFALVYFSDRRIAKMIKNINSIDRDKLLKGIKNAAWDMTNANYWAEKAIENRNRNNLWIFCTEDRALKEIIPLIASPCKSDKELKEKSRAIFLKYLGENDGAKVYDLYDSLIAKANSNERKGNILSTEALYSVIEEQEEKLLAI